MVVVGLVKKDPSVRENFVAIVDAESGGENSCEKFSVIGGPLAMRGRVRLANTHAGSGLHVPNLHLPVQVAKPCQTDKPAQVAPNHLVLVLLAKLKRNHVVLREKNWLCRHEAAYDQIVLPLPVPLEVVERALVGLHLCNFVGSVTVEVESVLPIVRFSGGVEVGLQLDEETVRNW